MNSVLIEEDDYLVKSSDLICTWNQLKLASIHLINMSKSDHGFNKIDIFNIYKIKLVVETKNSKGNFVNGPRKVFNYKLDYDIDKDITKINIFPNISDENLLISHESYIQFFVYFNFPMMNSMNNFSIMLEYLLETDTDIYIVSSKRKIDKIYFHMFQLSHSTAESFRSSLVSFMILLQSFRFNNRIEKFKLEIVDKNNMNHYIDNIFESVKLYNIELVRHVKELILEIEMKNFHYEDVPFYSVVKSTVNTANYFMKVSLINDEILNN